jgi:hypothetical protein
MAISNPMAPPITNNNSSSRGTRRPVRKWPIVAGALARATIAFTLHLNSLLQQYWFIESQSKCLNRP